MNDIINKRFTIEINTNGKNILEVLVSPESGDSLLFEYSDHVQGINNISIVCSAIREVMYRIIIDLQQNIINKEIQSIQTRSIHKKNKRQKGLDRPRRPVV
jgi:hypothetical protein